MPGDKSISHRALIFGALASGTTQISNLLEAEDVASTQKCLKYLGIEFTRKNAQWTVHGQGRVGFSSALQPLPCGNSGTTLRLLLGALSPHPFQVQLVGDPSLSRRPMKRVAEPLRKMGVQIHLTHHETAPVIIQGCSSLQAISYSLPVASAQLKSAILLAALSAEGTTRLSGKIQSRDHTERLLAHFGAKLEFDPGVTSLEGELSIQGGQNLVGTDVKVPGDISSAAFWLGLGALVPCGRIEIQDVLLNPTRTGILNILDRMGARIRSEITHTLPEPSGWIQVEYSDLKGIEIQPAEIPTLIDELPLIAILATFATGMTIVRGAEELRIKETDRIEAIAKNLRTMGGKIELFPDGFAIEGPQVLQGAALESFGDHRIAMAFSIAALRATSASEIYGRECVSISYPTFYKTLNSLTSPSSTGISGGFSED